MTGKVIDLLTEFDEMGYIPTTFTGNPEQVAIDWKNRLIAAIEAENAALCERLDKAVDKELIAKELAEIFDCPCNFTPLDEEMQKYCGDDCIDDSEVCWQRFIEKTVKKRLTELGGEK